MGQVYKDTHGRIIQLVISTAVYNVLKYVYAAIYLYLLR